MPKQSKQTKATTSPDQPPEGYVFPHSTDSARAPELNLANHFLIAMPSMLDSVFSGSVVYLCEHNPDGALGVIINKPTDMTMEVLLERIDLKIDAEAGVDDEGGAEGTEVAGGEGRDNDDRDDRDDLDDGGDARSQAGAGSRFAARFASKFPGRARAQKPAEPAALRRQIGAGPVMFGGPVQVERGFVLHAPRGQFSSMMRVSDDISLTTSRDVLEAVASGDGPRRLLVTLGCAGWSAGQLEQEIVRNGWLTVAADPDIIFDLPIEARFAAALKLLGIDAMMLSGEAGHA
jgi:putative AlgH/UPF0301 family transcriptional regulator